MSDNKQNKKLTIGLLAHVDAGKTSLSESILYESGAIRKSGRVDHQDSFFDFDRQERDRGITIFSKQAVFEYEDTTFYMIDTPGHVDFSCEMERTLSVLDVAVLVINGQSGVEAHTSVIYRLLQTYHIPVFIFVNKMDIAYASKDALFASIKKDLKANLVNFEAQNLYEEVAMYDDHLLERYLEGDMNDEDVIRMVNECQIIPVCFGSALKNEGVKRMLDMIVKYVMPKKYDDEFSAYVYKITHINNTRLAFVKINGGKVRVKSQINDEKIDEIRLYNGLKFSNLEYASAGDICAFKGLKNVLTGDTLGKKTNEHHLNLEPYLKYMIIINDNTDIKVLYAKMKELEDEDPKLNLLVDNDHIYISLMGEIQKEILKKMVYDRFNIDISFDNPIISYKETIKDTVIGIGHFEPLRHYAEVHLLLEPLNRGSGVEIENKCISDSLPLNYQRQVISLLSSREHRGILTNSPLTDIRISLLNGKAHLKHTEGGDFMEATYRALRQSLTKATSEILEPYCEFVLKVKEEYMSKAIFDLERFHATHTYSIDDGEVTFRGKSPLRLIMNYSREVVAYTKGTGSFYYSFKEYDKAFDEEEIIKEKAYDFKRDTDNPAGSIFCANGAGYYVDYDEVDEKAHLNDDYFSENTHTNNYNPVKISDEELERIFERSNPVKKDKTYISKDKKNIKYKSKDSGLKPICYVIDGYNVIHSDEYLKSIAKESIADARDAFVDMVCNFKPIKNARMIVVFDAYKRDEAMHKKKYDGIDVIYTSYQMTADAYIEKSIKELNRDYRVYVVSSDSLIQNAIFSQSAFRVSSKTFMSEMNRTLSRMSSEISSKTY